MPLSKRSRAETLISLTTNVAIKSQRVGGGCPITLWKRTDKTCSVPSHKNSIKITMVCNNGVYLTTKYILYFIKYITALVGNYGPPQVKCFWNKAVMQKLN